MPNFFDMQLHIRWHNYLCSDDDFQTPIIKKKPAEFIQHLMMTKILSPLFCYQTGRGR